MSISHNFGGLIALDRVDLAVVPGRVHALLGQNGSGKSTLIRALTGALSPRLGDVRIDDEVVRFESPASARHHGVGVVHQSYHLFPEMTVADNVMSSTSAPPRARSWLVDRQQLFRQAASVLSELGIDLDLQLPVSYLGPAERKLVEIARAMVTRPRFLILDEPTAALEAIAAAQVLDLIRTLRAAEVGIVMVTHRLDEVLWVADEVTVLRDGRRTAHLCAAGLDERALASHVIGTTAAPEPLAHRSRRTRTEVAISVDGLPLSPTAPAISLSVHRGEVLGLTGVLGSGAAAVARMLAGAQPCPVPIQVGGQSVRIRHPVDARRHGIGFVPEDRVADGLFQGETIEWNIGLVAAPSCAPRWFLRQSQLTARAKHYRDVLAIKTHSVAVPVSTLSGGNQQKVLIAKWLGLGISVLIVEEPTQGVDVGGKKQIHELVQAFADEGGAVVLASTDTRETLGLADRIAVFRDGAIVHLTYADELSHSDLAYRGLARSGCTIQDD